ncbi:hypothetical protein HNY73_009148 [Argiope bruennichi]|uniref:Uncharacterized protein n=1 Tax=Argiope bruennichi TaxID=94029 RepID=A0A8T0F8N3_ARGBR|nr:hypothetical protein HNY73_009148 [Argiope bruennichi]
MLHSSQLIHLYTRVLEDTSFVNNVNEKDMKQAIEHMHKIYRGSANSLSKNLNYLADFNEVTYRCAYLFKYAPFHTALSYTAMSHALTESSYELRAILDSLSGPLKLCSLGSGPGTDVIGVLAAMHDQFGFFPSSVKLVDIMSEWELTFWSIIDELRFGQQNYGSLSESVSEKWFDWSFVTADLQNQISRELTEVLGTADIVTMIKFVSAAACKETTNMIERIFRLMKPGAFVLFVDNAAGGYEKLISNAANKYELNAISTPLKHQHYINEAFNCSKYGFRSCYESKVAMQLLMKSDLINCSNENHLIVNLSCNENFPLSSVPFKKKIQVPEFQNFRIGPKLFDNPLNDHKAFVPESLSNLQISNFFLSSDFSPKLDRLKKQIENPVNLCKSLDSESSWSSRPHSLASQNWSVRDESQIYDPEYQSESFGHELPLKAHNSNKIDFLDDDNFPSFYWQKMHVPKLQNFRMFSKPIGGPLNEHDTFNHGPLSVFPVRNISPSSKFFSESAMMKMQNDYSISHNKSFESKLTLSLPLDSSPPISSIQNNSIRVIDQIYDSMHENDLFEGKLHCNTSLDRPLITQVSQTVTEPILYVMATDDSGYSEESFERELLRDSPACNNLFNTRFSPKHGKSDDTFHEKESFWNTSTNNLTQHSTLISENENSSLASVYYRPSLHQLNQSPRISFEGLDNSDNNQNSLNFESPYHQTWNNDCHLLGALQYPGKYIRSKGPSSVSVDQSKLYESKVPEKKQSKNVSLSLEQPHQHSKKSKVPKKYCNVSVHRCKPYEIKRSLTKQSKVSLLSSQSPQHSSEKLKALKRNCNVSVHQCEPSGIERSSFKQSKQRPLPLQSLCHCPEKFKSSKKHFTNTSVHQYKPSQGKESMSKQSNNNPLSLEHLHSGKSKALKKHCDVSVHQHKPNDTKRSLTKQSKHKPNDTKRSLTKQSKQNPVPLLRAYHCSEKFKAVKRYCNVPVHQHKSNETDRSPSKQSKQRQFSLRHCPENFKSLKRHCNVSVHQRKPTERKESAKEQSNNGSLSMEQPHHPKELKEPKRHCNVSVHQPKPKDL